MKDPGDPRLLDFGERKDALLRQQNRMIVDSDKVVLRMMAKGHYPSRLLATERFVALLDKQKIKLPRETELFLGERPVLESIVGHRLHHGVVAIAGRPRDVAIEELGPRIVLLNGVGSAENVGAIARSCHAFGFTALVADEVSCSPYVRRSIRVSMGSLFCLNIHHTPSCLLLIEKLRAAGYGIYGSGKRNGSVSAKGFKPKEKFVLILGSEGDGMEPSVIEQTDTMLEIPVHPGIDSLNVAVASGVLLYELGKI